MENYLICNIILDSCGVLILLLAVLPYFTGIYSRKANRRKGNLLFFAALTHFFVLVFRIAGISSVLILSHTGATDIFSVAAMIPAIISAVLLTLCIFCDDTGRISMPKGKNIPVGQIACAVLPPVISYCLQIALPAFSFYGLAWSAALQLNQYIIQTDSVKRIEAIEQRLDRDQALLMTVQMQPHFVFNTISSIETLCQSDPDAAAESLENLSGYLRSNIDALTSEVLIPFDDELRHIRQYIALELADPARQFIFDYELDARDFLLPSLTIQPIVENAVKHGALTRRDGKGHVLLTTEEFGTYIRITVTDNGTNISDLTAAQHERRGIGIENTRKRLDTLCGGSLKISSGESGTKAVMLIPKKKE